MDKLQFTQAYADMLAANEHRLGKYKTITGYLSATRMLSDMKDKTGLDAWRDRVGHETANRITEQAKKRGTEMHECIELFHANETFPNDIFQTDGYKHYLKMQPYLSNIDPWGVECSLWSDKLQITGKTDTLGTYNGVLSVIDYKSSRRPKQAQYMLSYRVQVSLYAIMLYDMLGLKVKQAVLLNSPEDEEELLPNPAQEFVFSIADTIPLALEMLGRHKQGDRNCYEI